MCDKADPYCRPSDWLTLPVVSAGEEKFVGLHAVYDCDSNFVTVYAEGAYTVDWGDGGATEDVASGTATTKNLSYSDYGDLTSRGYRQAIITITPQAGQSLTNIELQRMPSSPSLSYLFSTSWLDIRMAGANVSSITTYGASDARQAMLEQFEYIGSNSITSCENMFRGCTALRNIVQFDTSSCTDFSYMFYGCYSLTHAPMLDASSATTFSNMFNSCCGLTTVPPYSSSSVTTFSTMFSGCYSLRNVACFDTSAGTTFSYMFASCYSLETVPSFDTSSATSFLSAFNNCYALQRVPVLDTSSCTNLARLFYNCFSLKDVPALDTSSCTDFSYMFYRCQSLGTAPNLDTSAGLDLNNMFARCSTLTTVPLLDTSSATSIASMFYDCVNLEYVPALDVSNVTNFGGAFYHGYSLRSAALSGTASDVSYTGCLLGASDLNDIFTGLATVGSGTITVTNCYGVTQPGYDSTIATAKGWTVTA
ncbi:MAG: BspA family leucine-rich repeat surface protein [Candidatus Woesebacteria bacterium]|jgi:surface protein